MSRERKQFVFSIVLVVFSAFLLLFSSITFAWVATNKQVKSSNPDMSIDDTICPEIKVYTYYTEAEASEYNQGIAEDKKVQAGWVESDVADGSTGFNHVIDNYNQHGGAFKLPSLPLGTIDNLVRPNLDNTMYIRFAITPSSLNDKFKLRIKNVLSSESSDYPFMIYKDNGDLVDKATKYDATSTVYEKIRSKIEDGDQVLELFNLEYYVTSSEVADLTSLDKATFEKVDASELTFPKAGGTLSSADTYYLYVRIQPNSRTFANIVRYLYAYMPCVLLYDFDIEYDMVLGE